MLLKITTTCQPASDLSYLLHKHPHRCHVFNLSFGRAQVFYPQVSASRCTAALMLDIDPLELVQSFRGRSGPRMIEHYINDRAYATSSFMSVALAKVFGSAMAGKSKERQGLCDSEIALEIELTALPARGGAQLLRDLFQPLEYDVDAKIYPLDPAQPQWGDSQYYDLQLKTIARLQDVLRHLYVLIPVLDKDKHYWVGEDEVEKLLQRGKGWLEDHPRRDLIMQRYLKFQSQLTKIAAAALVQDEDSVVPDLARAKQEKQLEKPLNLNQARYAKVIEILKSHDVGRVVDLGCGEGKLLKRLLSEKSFSRIVGVDVSSQALNRAEQRLRLERMPQRQHERVKLLQGSLVYRDARLKGYDAAVCIEVIEHLEPDRLDAFEQVVFANARPALVIVTTPNREYNTKFENLAAGKLRHPDHRFEWTRTEFAAWSAGVAKRNGYQFEILSIGDEDANYGPPTQAAVFNI